MQKATCKERTLKDKDGNIVYKRSQRNGQYKSWNKGRGERKATARHAKPNVLYSKDAQSSVHGTLTSVFTCMVHLLNGAIF